MLHGMKVKGLRHTHTHTHTHTQCIQGGGTRVYAWDEGQGAEAIGKCVRMLAVRCESQAVSSSSSLDGGCRESCPYHCHC